MLTPAYMKAASEYLVHLYDTLEEQIVKDIARRIVKTGKLTETAEYQAVQMQHMGALRDEIIQRVAIHAAKTEPEIRRVFEEAEETNVETNAAPLIKHGIAVETTLSAPQRQILEAAVVRCAGDVYNMTLTTATGAAQSYYEASNGALMKVLSGAFSPAEAIYQAVKSASKDGPIVQFDKRRDKMDVAIRRNVLTSLGQVTAKITEMNAQDLDAEYYETSAHPGARPSHEEWQGQVFKIEGSTAEYPNFEESTDYGDPGGICGINCRHSFYPFFPGLSERAYSPDTLAFYRDHTVDYDGDTYTDYEASQIQRAMERNIRETKRELAGLDAARQAAAGSELEDTLKEGFDEAAVLLKKQEGVLRDFLEQTGRDAENDRVRVPGFDRSVSQKAVWANMKASEESDSK